MKKVLVISGITAAGKSSAARRFAQKFGAEIVSCDSTKVYRHYDVGTNKPTRLHLSVLKHHLVDFVKPGSIHYSAGEFFDDAQAALTNIYRRKSSAVVVGGTWMYLRFLLYGKPSTGKVDPPARELVSHMLDLCKPDWDYATSLLEAVDPGAAEMVSRNNWARLARYLEIFFHSGSTISDHGRRGGSPGGDGLLGYGEYDFRPIFLVAPRAETWKRIDNRCRSMLRHNGIIEEVAFLLENDLIPDGFAVSRSVGYAETKEVLLKFARGIEQTRKRPAVVHYVEQMVYNNRKLARNQLKVFKKEPDFVWVDTVDAQSLDETLVHLFQCSREEFDAYRNTREVMLLKEHSLARDREAMKMLKLRNYNETILDKFFMRDVQRRIEALAEGVRKELNIIPDESGSPTKRHDQYKSKRFLPSN
ncbi:hypothetical protein NDN08_001083 [Rhodosorus marinus]|uniref:tRNA dimethylallyltransferase n=1 Tax=Rhodosorus marinus TaxID=101924 RepID=A0AAV8UPS1_9RHOD|nr:hypothetical protein NDN08_001083 [Rhodosorus marinus]